MGKLKDDQYYTPSYLAEYCVVRTIYTVGEENITQYLEPSAGTGVFIDHFGAKEYLAFDIDPKRDDITKLDYLKLDIEYKIGRCVIGNPPFGKGNYTSVKFYKRAIMQGDFVAFILPISQLNNNLYMYEFDMVHSEDLGINCFTDREIHCCFNIYKRNCNGFNSRPVYKLQDVSLKGVATGKTRNDKIPSEYDFSICSYGSVGRFADKENQYCQQIYFTIHNKRLIQKIKETIENTDWTKMYSMVSTPKIKHWMIIKLLKEKIPEIK